MESNNLTWRCRICKEERPDERIDVITYPMKGLPGAEINLKYCNDNVSCIDAAYKQAGTGKL